MPDILFPEEFIEQIQNILPDEYSLLLDSLQKPALTSIRYNLKVGNLSSLPENSIDWCENAYYLPTRPNFVQDPLWHAGNYYVQEASSMIIADIYKQLDKQTSDSQKILDLCAAPGGKSTLLLSQMKENDLLIANEISTLRAQILEQNLSKWGKANYLVSNNKSEDFQKFKEYFDLILIDAPCSGEGLFRKDKEIIQNWSIKNVQNCSHLQKSILQNSINCLKTGGHIIYCTCTYNSIENEEVLLWILDKFPELKLKPYKNSKKYPLTSILPKTYHCFPHKFSGEGFFFAILQKTSDLPDADILSTPKEDKLKGATKAFRTRLTNSYKEFRIVNKDSQLREIQKFFQNQNYTLYQEKEQIIAIPSHLANDILEICKSLKTLKIALNIGEMRGEQFIPSQDIASSQTQNPNIPIIQLNKTESLQYLKGYEINKQESWQEGWNIVQFEKTNLGWLKVLSTRTNNHYPKSWRIKK